MRRTLLLLAALATVWAGAPAGHAARAASYTAGGTAVVRQNGNPTLDEGTLVCRAATGEGIGGACLTFATDLDSVFVADRALGREVAFQVCIDNDGDFACTSPAKREGTASSCGDFVVFSHSDDGRFFNPLGPLPQSFPLGCRGGFPGYLVFICNGAHQTADATGSGDSHVHPATAGSATLTRGGTGFGNFCGGSQQEPSVKSYTITS